MTDVMISYARSDARDFARRLALALRSGGVDAWLDTSDIEGGAEWLTRIEREINDCKVFIAIRTPKAKNDDWVNISIQDNGDYEFASYREIGVFSGKGNLAVKDGKAVGQSEKGSVTLQLLTDKNGGQTMLKAESKGKDGINYRAELKPSKKQK